MTSDAQIVLLEDDVNDVELIQNELSKAGLVFSLHHVKDKAGFVGALSRVPPDLILSDYNIPQFDGMTALRIAKEMAPQVPFVMVTGSVSEETAVQCMKAGAADYVLKDRLFLLAPAVKAVMEVERHRAEKRRAEGAVALLAAIVESSNDAIISKTLDSIIRSWNKGAERIFGYAAAEVVGQPITLLIPPELQNEENQILEKIKQGKSVEQFETVRIGKDGRRINVSLTVSPIKGSTGSIVGASNIARDITDRKRAEEQLRASLKEKEVLLSEVHHRVKNNLQVISSLLSLQSDYIKSPDVLAIFKESQGRIRSMALVHERLYQSQDFAEVDFAEYLRHLAPQLLRSFGVNFPAIRFQFDVERVSLRVDTAIPCALIVNELITNSFKHAFPNGRQGQVLIGLRTQPDGRVELSVRDDGIGLPQTLDVQRVETLGLQLVQTLSEQLGASLQVQTNGGGAGFTVIFHDSSKTAEQKREGSAQNSDL